MNSSLQTFAGWIRCIRLNRLISVPGDAVAGFLLASGGKLCVWSPQLGWICLAAVMVYLAGALTNEIANLKSDCTEQPWKPVPAGQVPPRTVVIMALAAVILALIFAAIPVAPAPIAAIVLMLIAAASFCFSAKINGLRSSKAKACLAADRALVVLSGAAMALTMLKEQGGYAAWDKQWIIVTLIYAAGEFLFVFGALTASADKKKILPVRPGRHIFLTGAILSYAVLFLIVMGKPTQNWHSLTCGAVSALTSAAFLVLTYWSFRFFFFPLPPSRVRATLELQVFALIFLQAAAVSAQGVLIPAGALIVFAVLSKIIDVKFNLRGPV